jgi:phospholipid/cholesterol/gamma-HCH transport system substrate-binding protein
MDNNIKIPVDSSASITSQGLLGGNYVAISPGGSNTMMRPGQSFAVTQSAINIEDLLGKFIFSLGGSSSSGKSGAGPAAPAAAGSK